MIVRLYSDLHLELGDYDINPLPGDADSVLVLAGDIAERIYGEIFVERCCKQFRKVIYVLGNHEFYRGEYFKVIAQWKDIEKRIENLHVLHNETLIVDDVRFLGTTLWSDMNDRDWFAMQAANGINDYHVVKIKHGENYRKLRPSDTVSFFSNAMYYLKKELDTEFDGKTVVVTHFSPSPSLVCDEFAGSNVNPYFHANCDELFNNYKIDYWMFGHTHRPVNKFLGDTHVITNQRGYVGYEKELGFDHDFWLDV
jgi:predicted phosphodiesterase